MFLSWKRYSTQARQPIVPQVLRIIPQDPDYGKRGKAMSDEHARGRIEVSPIAVATIANHAVLNSYGVVGMSSKNLVNGLAQVLRPDSKRGVEVHIDEDVITIDLYVVIEYGLRIAVVAENIMTSTKFNVEKAMGVPVASVNVHVQGLRVSEGKAKPKALSAAHKSQPSASGKQASRVISSLEAGHVEQQ
jgi:uncharacterized alkaline shock family protein YloU